MYIEHQVLNWSTEFALDSFGVSVTPVHSVKLGEVMPKMTFGRLIGRELYPVNVPHVLYELVGEYVSIPATTN